MVDPEATAAQPAGTKGEVRIEEPTRGERTIARRSAEARATVPDLELAVEVMADASLALAARQRCTIDAILVRACALALREVPRANGAYRDGGFELYSRINIGLLLTTAEAHVAPTVFDADEKTLPELSAEIATLATRADAGQLSPPEQSGSTFTLWNCGSLGIASAVPLIGPSHAAAVAAGAIREIPTVRDGAIVAGHSMTITLACDHRILYGAQAAQFLTGIKTLLEEAKL